MKRGAAKKLESHERFRIEVIHADGELLAPAKHANIFKGKCGGIGRDNFPITIEEWHKPKKEGSEQVTYVEQHTKDLLWDLLMVNFTLPPELDPENPLIAKRVKAWALKKMSTQFEDWKKRLNLKYVQKDLTPD